MKSKSSSPLAKKLALVTGANRGIGFEVAQALARGGCDLIISARDGKSLAQTARKVEKLGVRVLAQTCDVRDPNSVDCLFTRIRALRRPLDFLVNNAGMAHPSRNVSDLPYPTWRDVIETNLTGMFLVTQAGLAVMKRGSVIVNNLSTAAERAFPGSAGYCASKHGALGFTDTLREELRPEGIRVIALVPGATDTRLWDTLWPKAPRRKMMSAATVAQALVNALTLPPDSVVEKLVIRPPGGTL
ncbi:MAG TPA: SDR family NAD(P)-dependent oxidoreductase [Terriglobales bacterium]|nr:SDR family NAD(P)-dependent oxidoreductase [Terriglobales bacterium]